MRDELLNCEIFDTMQEAKVLIERWRTLLHPIAHLDIGHLLKRAGWLILI